MIKLIKVQFMFTSPILADFTSIGASGSAMLVGGRSRLTSVTKPFFLET